MEKNFNLSRYKELLKLEESGKISLLDETYLELLTYQASVEQQISYNRKNHYFLLIHQYLTKSIIPYEFRAQFLQMEKKDSKEAVVILKDFLQLEVFMLAEDLDEFSDLINRISSLCFEYDEVWDGTMERMSENEFYFLIKNLYFQLCEIFSNNQKYEDLISRSFKFLMVTLGLEILLLIANF